MRTSASQFDLLVSFMERHGDLSRPSDGAHGRITNIQRWTELATLLNADATGDTKVEEKWKKTWSDLKNNTKRKAAKINRAASGTGGGPASKLKLSDIEERVLGIMNPQAVTGMSEVHEVGLGQDVIADILLDTENSSFHGYDDRDPLESWNEPGSSSQPPMFAPAPPESQQPQIHTPESQQPQIHTPESQQPQIHTLQSQQPQIHTPQSQQPQIHIPQSQQPQRRSPSATPPRVTMSGRRHLDHRSSTTGQSSKRRRPATSTQSEIARQCFLNSDQEWLALNKEKEEKAYELEKERLRLREIELQHQAKWQEICANFLIVFEKLSNSIINKDK